MNVFVTGGAGYIGSAAAVQLMAAGHRVTVFDNPRAAKINHELARALYAELETIVSSAWEWHRSHPNGYG